MITSRSDESDKLSKIEFDRIAEVTGFSEQQVTEYVERYFRQNESLKRTVLEHITKNENLVSLAYIRSYSCPFSPLCVLTSNTL